MADPTVIEAREVRFAAPDGIVLAGEEAGPPDAPLVVLMHGGGQTRHSWSGALAVLARRGYHVINFDARGHGDSEWSRSGDYSLPVRARDLMAVLGGRRSRYALVGASLGGATAMQAISMGLRPDALVLVDIVPRPSVAGVARITGFMTANPNGFATLQEAADAIAAYNPARPRPADPSGLMKNLRHDGEGRLRWHWDPRMLEGDGRDPAQLARAIEGQDWGRDMPTLLVRGRFSDIVTDHGVEDLRRFVPHLEVFEVPGAGHMVAGDRNDAFNAGVLDYLDRVMPA